MRARIIIKIVWRPNGLFCYGFWGWARHHQSSTRIGLERPCIVEEVLYTRAPPPRQGQARQPMSAAELQQVRQPLGAAELQPYKIRVSESSMKDQAWD